MWLPISTALQDEGLSSTSTLHRAPSNSWHTNRALAAILPAMREEMRREQQEEQQQQQRRH
jgi:hypothetical protein